MESNKHSFNVNNSTNFSATVDGHTNPKFESVFNNVM